MEIFNYFAAFCLIVIIFRVVLLFIMKESGEEKVFKIITYVISMALLLIAWAAIYAFFGYEVNGSVKNAPISKNKTEQQDSKKNNVVKFEDE